MQQKAGHMRLNASWRSSISREENWPSALGDGRAFKAMRDKITELQRGHTNGSELTDEINSEVISQS